MVIPVYKHGVNTATNITNYFNGNYPVQTSVNLSCATGYYLWNQKPYDTAVCSGAEGWKVNVGGTWTPIPTPICLGIFTNINELSNVCNLMCRLAGCNPINYTNCSVTYNSDIVQNEVFLQATIVGFSAYNNFYLNPPITTATCLSTGVWSVTIPECIRNTVMCFICWVVMQWLVRISVGCSSSIAVANAGQTYSLTISNVHPNQSTNTIRCDPGFYVEGQNTNEFILTCINGNWQPTLPQCTRN